MGVGGRVVGVGSETKLTVSVVKYDQNTRFKPVLNGANVCSRA